MGLGVVICHVCVYISGYRNKRREGAACWGLSVGLFSKNYLHNEEMTGRRLEDLSCSHRTEVCSVSWSEDSFWMKSLYSAAMVSLPPCRPSVETKLQSSEVPSQWGAHPKFTRGKHESGAYPYTSWPCVTGIPWPPRGVKGREGEGMKGRGGERERRCEGVRETDRQADRQTNLSNPAMPRFQKSLLLRRAPSQYLFEHLNPKPSPKE